jgi:hypothetical protein
MKGENYKLKNTSQELCAERLAASSWLEAPSCAADCWWLVFFS